MKLKGLKLAFVSAIVLCVIGLPGCARDQQLVSISVVPDTETFGASNIPVPADAGLSVQLRALGQYIHPPVTKDITSTVTWAANDTQMVTVTSGGLLTATGNVCGKSIVSATIKTGSSGAIVTGSMTAEVVCFTGTGGGGSNPILTVVFAPGTGSGTVISTPSGINCTSTCSATFTNGSAVNVTAAPNTGSTFGNWAGCDSISGPTCIINSLTAARTVTVTFN
ncbi:MAG TPA: hypothetical protein VEV41_14865 [Terriglobales bacterium]|nr:hypothetical protein [Terriglobales bacterium]